MAIAIVSDSGTTPISSGTSYTPSNSGSNQGIVSLHLYRDGPSGATSSAYNVNSATLNQDISIVSQSLISFNMYATAGFIAEASIPAAGTYTATISTAAAGNGGYLSTLSGMKQTAAVVSDLQISTFANTSMPSLTYSCSAGDLILVGYESNGGTLTTPANASSGDAYVEKSNGAFTGSPLSQGKMYALIATSAMTSESVGNWLSGNNSGTIFLAVFSAAAGGGPTTTLLSTSFSGIGGLSNSKLSTMFENVAINSTASAANTKTMPKTSNVTGNAATANAKTISKFTVITSTGANTNSEGLLQNANSSHSATGTSVSSDSFIAKIGVKLHNRIRAIRNIVRSVVRYFS